MIEKMSHYTFLVYHQDYTDFLTKLQEIGILHVTPTREGNLEANGSLQIALQQAELFKKTLHQMADRLKKEEIEGIVSRKEKYALDRSQTEVAAICQEWLALCDRIANVKKLHTDLEADVKLMLPWGDFDMNNLNRLYQAGWEVRFWSVDHKRYDSEWEHLYHSFVISQDKKHTYFVTVNHRGKEIEMQGAIEEKLCPSPASTLVMLQTRAKDDLKKALLEQGDFALLNYATVHKALTLLLRSIDLQKAELATAGEADGKVMLLEGWVPTRRTEEINNLLEKEEVYFESREATREDNAPILLRNNAFNRLYEVLIKMYGMPSYSEFDPTPIVAPFYMLFFGFCMGDAAYGLLLVLVGFFLKKKLGKPMEGMMNLVITLGIGTTIMGAIFSSFFGADLFDFGLPEWMRSYVVVGKLGETLYDKQMVLALGIGVFHICFALVVKAICTHCFLHCILLLLLYFHHYAMQNHFHRMRMLQQLQV